MCGPCSVSCMCCEYIAYGAGRGMVGLGMALGGEICVALLQGYHVRIQYS